MSFDAYYVPGIPGVTDGVGLSMSTDERDRLKLALSAAYFALTRDPSDRGRFQPEPQPEAAKLLASLLRELEHT